MNNLFCKLKLIIKLRIFQFTCFLLIYITIFKAFSSDYKTDELSPVITSTCETQVAPESPAKQAIITLGKSNPVLQIQIDEQNGTLKFSNMKFRNSLSNRHNKFDGPLEYTGTLADFMQTLNELNRFIGSDQGLDYDQSIKLNSEFKVLINDSLSFFIELNSYNPNVITNDNIRLTDHGSSIFINFLAQKTHYILSDLNFEILTIQTNPFIAKTKKEFIIANGQDKILLNGPIGVNLIDGLVVKIIESNTQFLKPNNDDLYKNENNLVNSRLNYLNELLFDLAHYKQNNTIFNENLVINRLLFSILESGLNLLEAFIEVDFETQNTPQKHTIKLNELHDTYLNSLQNAEYSRDTLKIAELLDNNTISTEAVFKKLEKIDKTTSDENQAIIDLIKNLTYLFSKENYKRYQNFTQVPVTEPHDNLVFPTLIDFETYIKHVIDQMSGLEIELVHKFKDN